MCYESEWLCHCCEETVLHVHFNKCYDTITGYNLHQTIFDPNHKIDIKKNLTLWGMCKGCQRVCFEKCQLKNKKNSCICQ
jgi:hypothetical protein